MATYKAPLRDISFVLHELWQFEDLAQLPGYEEATRDLVDAVLEEGAKFCENELFPLNRSGDEEGCTYENGVVRTPKGFKEAYDAFAEGGWLSLSFDPEYGGQGLPKALNVVLEELICASNLSFGMYPGLSGGAYNAVEMHGDDALKARYLPKLADGTWSGTMCLTEPQCGTDLGLIRSKAEPGADGAYSITGTKIFISAGEHDLTENILHLVLARLPDAPEGIKGISLFLVPKFLPNEDNSVGPSNGVQCSGIEHKMGIKASSTCVMNFDDATGWLVGEPHRGMRAMFTMMNTARLGVGVQGLGISDVAYQGAVEYARERLQGRALTGAKNADGPADPIIVHPDVRRMLLTMKANTEAARALAYWIGMQVDIAHKHPDPDQRDEAEDLLALMTPILKARFTDMGFESANLGVQVYGGHGYIREHGMEQYVRDARITQLYEGTDGVEALELVGRKLGAHVGRMLRRFFKPLAEFLEANKGDDTMTEFVKPLAKAFGRLQEGTTWIAQNGMRDPDEAGAAAVDYLQLFALVAYGWMWARMAKVALEKQGGDEAEFYQAKLATGRFFMTRILPESASHLEAIKAGKAPIMELAEAAF